VAISAVQFLWQLDSVIAGEHRVLLDKCGCSSSLVLGSLGNLARFAMRVHEEALAMRVCRRFYLGSPLCLDNVRLATQVFAGRSTPILGLLERGTCLDLVQALRGIKVRDERLVCCRRAWSRFGNTSQFSLLLLLELKLLDTMFLSAGVILVYKGRGVVYLLQVGQFCAEGPS